MKVNKIFQGKVCRIRGKSTKAEMFSGWAEVEESKLCVEYETV